MGTVEGKAVNKSERGGGEWWKCGKMERSSQVRETVEEITVREIIKITLKVQNVHTS